MLQVLNSFVDILSMKFACRPLKPEKPSFEPGIPGSSYHHEILRSDLFRKAKGKFYDLSHRKVV